MITLSIKDAQDLIETSTNRIDFLLKEFKKLDGLTREVYESLGVLDDLVIEYEDLYRNYKQAKKAYDKLRVKNVAITKQIMYNENKKEIHHE